MAYEAIEGIGRKPAHLKILSAMYSNTGMFIVRADSSYRTIGDLKGTNDLVGAKQFRFKVVLFGVTMDGLGLDLDNDFKAVLLDKAADGPAMVLDGRVAALWGGGVGWPGFTAVSKGTAGALRLRQCQTGETCRAHVHPGESIAAEQPWSDCRSAHTIGS